jgi:hypothetical protein
MRFLSINIKAMSLQKPLEIDVYSDAGFKDYQFVKVSEDKIKTYDDMKKVVADSVTGQQTFDGNPARLVIQVHYVDWAPRFTLEQSGGTWTVNYNVSADPVTVSEFEKCING